MSERYNVVVIGAGSAGLVSAYICAAVNARVALIERDRMGGDCLNTGCVPSKAIIRTARYVADLKRHNDFGVKHVDYDLDFGEVMRRVHDIVAEIEPHDSVERYTGLGVDVVQGNAEIVDAHTVRVGERILETRNIILAMGAEPLVPPIEGLDKIDYLTSENLWDLKALPGRLVVLGGGPIGAEMAQSFRRLGSSVTMVEMAPRILPREDEDVAEVVVERFRSEGVEMLVGAKATKVETRGEETVLLCERADEIVEVPFDEILIAVGRSPRTGEADWKKLGIELNRNRTIRTDEYLRVNGKNIFACGDVAGPFQFTHTASHQAWYCAVNALARPFKKFKVDYRVIPWVTYTDPEVAHVGLNESMAKERGVAYEVTRYGIDDLDRAIAESDNYGFVKVLTPPGKDEILGATIVSHNAGELIVEFIAGMKHGFGMNGILGTIHPYPTWAEANKYAAGNWKRANAPQWALNLAEKFFAWRR